MLLMLDGHTGKLVTDGVTPVDPMLAGAVLVDLALGAFVDIARGEEDAKAGRVFIRKTGPTTDPLLDEALATAAVHQCLSPSKLIGALGKGVRARVLDRPVAMGQVRVERRRILHILPRTRWNESDPRAENEVRERIWRTLFQDRPPDDRTSATISLLLTANVLTKIFPTEPSGADVDKKALTARSEEVADSEWGPGGRPEGCRGHPGGHAGRHDDPGHHHHDLIRLTRVPPDRDRRIRRRSGSARRCKRAARDSPPEHRGIERTWTAG